MTSESPGDSDVVENNFLRNKNILKKENPLNSRDGSQCLYLGNKLAMASSRLLLIALLVSSLVSRGKAEGFCEPVLLCSCQLSSANCSWRGLLTLPAGLHNNLKYLGEVLLTSGLTLLTEVVCRSLQQRRAGDQQHRPLPLRQPGGPRPQQE